MRNYGNDATVLTYSSTPLQGQGSSAISDRCCWRLRFLTVCAITTMLGCNNSGLETFDVTGQITYQGEPASGADIAFVPQDDLTLKPARGTSDDGGQYRLSVYVAPDNQPQGAMPGSYKVIIQKVETPKVDRVVDYQEEIRSPALRAKHLLPTVYSEVDSTPLTATVSPDGENRFDFDLED